MVEESGTLESQLEATKVTQTPLQFYSFIWEQLKSAEQLNWDKGWW